MASPLRRGIALLLLYESAIGVDDSAVFQHTLDYPDEYAPGYHVVSDTGRVVRAGLRQESANGSPNG